MNSHYERRATKAEQQLARSDSFYSKIVQRSVALKTRVHDQELQLKTITKLIQESLKTTKQEEKNIQKHLHLLQQKHRAEISKVKATGRRILNKQKNKYVSEINELRENLLALHSRPSTPLRSSSRSFNHPITPPSSSSISSISSISSVSPVLLLSSTAPGSIVQQTPLLTTPPPTPIIESQLLLSNRINTNTKTNANTNTNTNATVVSKNATVDNLVASNSMRKSNLVPNNTTTSSKGRRSSMPSLRRQRPSRVPPISPNRSLEVIEKNSYLIGRKFVDSDNEDDANKSITVQSLTANGKQALCDDAVLWDIDYIKRKVPRTATNNVSVPKGINQQQQLNSQLNSQQNTDLSIDTNINVLLPSEKDIHQSLQKVQALGIDPATMLTTIASMNELALRLKSGQWITMNNDERCPITNFPLLQSTKSNQDRTLCWSVPMQCEVITLSAAKARRFIQNEEGGRGEGEGPVFVVPMTPMEKKSASSSAASTAASIRIDIVNQTLSRLSSKHCIETLIRHWIRKHQRKKEHQLQIKYEEAHEENEKRMLTLTNEQKKVRDKIEK